MMIQPAQPVVGAVLVIGGGIAGMQASLDLGDAGFKVYLLERSTTIGGTMSQLDKTFPTNDCAMCIMAPKLVATGKHCNVSLITNAELEKLEGVAGHFKVHYVKKPRKIDETKCTGCGVCAQKCPVEAIDEFNEKLGTRGATSIRYPQAVPLVFSIDTNVCIGCGICKEECRANAVIYDEGPHQGELDVGSILLVPGFEEFNPTVKREYGYGIYPNVISSIQFERMLSASGPHAGLVVRPSDGEIPEKLAFIQCVGSRDHDTNPYCSAVCCMYAIKEAIIAKEHFEGIKPTLFYMDMRTYGKDFEQYYNRAKDEHGIRFIRSRVAKVEEDPATKNLFVHYDDGEQQQREEFNMVVLSVGFCPPPAIQELAKKLDIKLNKYNFIANSVFHPLDTNREGIYVGGAFAGPKDIPGTVAEASGAAARASSLISSARGTLVKKVEYPPEIVVAGQEPRIGVFVCHCGINIGGVVRVPEVVEYAKTLPNVVVADHNLYTCSADTQEKIKKLIKEHNLNRVIVASCTPRTHEPLFRNTCREAGLNPYLFEMANIRDQCSWVHMHEKDAATEKSKDLVRMAVAKSRLLEPLQKIVMPVKHSALVIGGGIAGMTAALELAGQGFKIHLVEKEKELGGLLKKIHSVLSENEDPQKRLHETIEKVVKNNNIKVHLGTTLKSVEGWVGNFTTTLSDNTKLEHGIAIIAVGGSEWRPTEYHYGEDGRIMTQLEFGEKLANGEFKGNTVVMIQCVGSREDSRPYCSRVCCGNAVKNALKLKEKTPGAKIYVLYRDMRTYAFMEDFYRTAGEKGVQFIRYEDKEKPEVMVEKDGICVRMRDAASGEHVELKADVLVLSAATLPNHDNEELGKLFKIPLNKDKFFLEAHMKLRPVDFATEGVFLAGLAHGPKYIGETIAQACGAAARATTVIAQDELEFEPTLSFVVDTNCDGCAYCVDPCPYKAITLIEYMRDGAVKKTVEVNEALCKGCGVCQATCPKKGIYVRGFKLDQIMAQIYACLGVGG